MDLIAFENWVKPIENSELNDKKKDRRIIQIVDLGCFIEAYNPSLEILDCSSYQICIVNDNGTKTGILFWDLKEVNRIHKSYTRFLDYYKRQTGIEKLWLVFVDERHSMNVRTINQFITEKYIKPFCDKILLLRFSHSAVYELG
ncbi:hypothetical protein [Sphingobacterium siyangense]|uniref:Uncharacterized protein n=1 Tax=Sphingobacterium siyangense TaxID=459529 RepID=A0A562MH00_9SPHI|nr:hypothetical protein [Sphingobacterium siyangense]TWI18811.1 hypothetical protein IQ31_02939 [Sphingobacterium siyangense]